MDQQILNGGPRLTDTTALSNGSAVSSTGNGVGDSAIVRIRILFPDAEFRDVLPFKLDETVWVAKQSILETVGKKGLVDGLNYGLYLPESNGRFGKFLDEERLLKDYPLPGPIAQLEFKYKKREPKTPAAGQGSGRSKKVNTSSTEKQFIECVMKSDVDGVTRWTSKGLDPNFNKTGKGETPLTVAATLARPRQVMMALVSGGSFLDFRNREGLTAMHVAAINGNRDAIRTLLDLGASPNYKDIRGLTPLYHCVLNTSTNAQCTQMLLHDRSEIGIKDSAGWTEVHQACKNGMVQHLEHLLFYGADINAGTSTGDTPLHICARYNKEECARVLLFRGADRANKNLSGEDAYQVACASGNRALADVIQQFRPEEVVLFHEMPKYNEKRRGSISLATIRNIQRSRSNPQLHLLFEPAGGSGGMLSSDEAGAASLSIATGHLYHNAGGYGPAGTPATVSGHGMAVRTRSSLRDSFGERQPQTVVIIRDANGFGFVLRGSKARGVNTSALDFKPTPEIPALQYIESVAPGGAAERAGLKTGDFLLEINGVNVVNATHEHSVSLLKSTGNRLELKVVPSAGQFGAVVNSTTMPKTGSSSPASQSSPAPSLKSENRLTFNGLKALEQLSAVLSDYETETPSGGAQMSHSRKSSDLSDVSSIPPPSYADKYAASSDATYASVIPKAARTAPMVQIPSIDYNDPSEDNTAQVVAPSFSVLPPPTTFSSNRNSTADDVERHPDYDADDVTSGAANGQNAFRIYGNVVNDLPPPSSFSSSAATITTTTTTNGGGRDYRANDGYYSRESPRLAMTTSPYPSPVPPPSFASPPPAPIPPPPPAPPLPASFSSVPPAPSFPSPMLSSGTPRQSNGPSSLPPQVQKQLDDSRKRDESHAALMAAVSRRRKLLESTDNEQVASSIESRVSRTQKLQTTVYRAGQQPSVVETKAAASASSSPGLLAPTKTENGAVSPVSVSVSLSSSSPPADAAKSSGGGATNGFVSEAEKKRQEFVTRKSANPVLPATNDENPARVKAGPMVVVPPPAPAPAPVVSPVIKSAAIKTTVDASKAPSASSIVPPAPTRTTSVPVVSASVSNNAQKSMVFKGGVPQSLPTVKVVKNEDTPIPYLPPPAEFATDASASEVAPATSMLKSVAKPSNSIVFKAGSRPVSAVSTSPATAASVPASATPAAASSASGAGRSITWPPKHYSERNMETWSVEEVGEWLESIDLGDFRVAFVQRGVTGKMMAGLKEGDFASYGLTLPIQRMKLERAVRQAAKVK